MNEFSLLETEIGHEPLLIEASAGTGKTFTIAALVLRLLLERPGLTINHILVTTFTDLATAELRGRIRDRLRDALVAFQSGKSDDELLRGVIDKYRDHRAAIARLQDALAHFDEAPIYTIHGFCQRVLAEQAFETGTLFDAELVTDERDLLREVTWDFWRRNFYRDDSLGMLLARQGKITPQKLLKDLEELTKNPTLTILPKELRTSAQAVVAVEEALHEVRRAWPKCAKGIGASFATSTWAKGPYKDPALLKSVVEHLDQLQAGANPGARHLESVELLAEKIIKKTGVKAGARLPENEIFGVCQEYADASARFCAALRAEFFAWAPNELRQRKQARNLLAFEDLLLRLNDSLGGPGGELLAQSIREQYRVALVDEFQDTDPIQYSIFDRIYAGSDATVAFIGDPKQAIYSFRGADVFTYLAAARKTQKQFTLRTNWRSESQLVGAVNTIFDQSDSFALEEIGFTPARPGPLADHTPLLFEGKSEKPFHIWTSDGDGESAECVASEIVRLLERGGTIGDEPLEPGHFAVLTHSNKEAAQVQVALRARRVPSVLYSTANVFASREADQMRDLLAAAAEPGNERLLRTALCTDALGYSGNQLEALSHDEAAWEKELLRFQKYHQLWREVGFVRMLRQLAVDYEVRRRLLGFRDGERRLTNFLHLSELLHAACVEHRLGMTGVLKWLAQEMQAGAAAPREECELRLESDEKAVRIITVHKSKGLEFDLVFCPYVGTNAMLRATFHNPDDENRLTLDLEDNDAHKELREKEALAESLRLFYVAVTRARHRCTIILPDRGKAKKSAPVYLGVGEHTGREEIALVERPEPNEHDFQPQRESARQLKARAFQGSIDRSWGIASFSRLVSGRDTDPLDEGPLLEPAAEEEVIEAQGIHLFPRGMHAGTCLHEILEEIDFTNLATAPEIVTKRLRAYGLEGFEEIVLENVVNLAALPLQPGKKSLRLENVPNESRIAELEFSFPVTQLTTAKLAAAFHRSQLPLQIERLQFPPRNGFMNGFIDLTFEHEGRFYFADWKSNWFGPTGSAYHPGAIAAEMQRSFYSLQLCIYSVALHRYLKWRKPDYDFDRHFGGAFYIFLRGIDPARPGQGVFFERLQRDFVEHLSAIFQE